MKEKIEKIWNKFKALYSGRSSRRELWEKTMISLFAALAAWVLELVLGWIGLPCLGASVSFAINWTVNLTLYFPVVSRRLHDLDVSGWHQLWFGLPSLFFALLALLATNHNLFTLAIASIIVSVLLCLAVFVVLYCVPGKKGDNRYGKDTILDHEVAHDFARLPGTGGEEENIIEVRNLKVWFPIKKGIFSTTVGYVKAVNGVSFDIKRGETLGVVGESGCGKSTTSRAILGLNNPCGGTIKFNSKDAPAAVEDPEDKYSLEGRAGLREIWKRTFASESFFALVITSIIFYAMFTKSGGLTGNVWSIIALLCLLSLLLWSLGVWAWGVVTTTARRFHDCGLSGRWALIGFLIIFNAPVLSHFLGWYGALFATLVGLGYFIIVYCHVGTVGPNEYGEDPVYLHNFHRKVQVIFQDPQASLNPRHTILDILTEGMIYHGLCDKKNRREEAVRLLEAVGMPSTILDRYPHEFSGGQRQRICIARAISLKPELLICDEAVSALDLSIRAQVLDLLGELKKKYNLSFLFITHDIGVVQHIADRIIVMNRGEIVEHGPCSEVLKNPKEEYTRYLMAAVPKIGKPLV